MHDNRDPTKHKCKTKVEDIVSVILAIAISVTALGLLGSIFKPGDSGGGFVKLEGSGSVTVGGIVDKEEDNTDNTTPPTASPTTPATQPPPTPAEPNTPNAGPWIGVGSGIVCVAAVAVVLLLRKKKHT